MAIGPDMYREEYKDYSIDELKKALIELEEFLHSKELKALRQEEIEKGIDDNNCVTNVETEIDVVKDLIKSKKSGTENEINKEIPRCPNCNECLSKSMPGEDVFFCNKCGKCFENDNGDVGKETTSPYTRKDVLY